MTTSDAPVEDRASGADRGRESLGGPGSFAGMHVLAELRGVAPPLLDDVEGLREQLRTSLAGSGATVHQVLAHRFAPQGVTVLAMLAESHASIHSYPEIGAAFVDVFTCGHAADPEMAVQRLATALNAEAVTTRSIRRGNVTVCGRPESSE